MNSNHRPHSGPELQPRFPRRRRVTPPPPAVSWLPGLGAAASLTLGGLLLSGCGHGSRPAAPEAAPLPPAVVRVQQVESGRLVATEEVVGTVRAKVRATVEASVMGRIARLPVASGDKVNAGDLLVQLDAREIEAKLDQARAALRQAETDLRRVTTLAKQGAATQAEFDAADSRQRAAAAAAAEAETMLGYVKLAAPFTGVITRKLAEVGDLAVPGKPLLELEDPTALRVEADVPEALVARARRGAKLSLRLGADPRLIESVVSEVSPAADPLSRTLRVKLDLPSGVDAQTGRFARLLVPVGESDVLRVPESAVVRRGQMEMVFVAAEGRARMHLVKTGDRAGGVVEVLSGLDAGDTVVVEGAAQLLDGQPLSAGK